MSADSACKSVTAVAKNAATTAALVEPGYPSVVAAKQRYGRAERRARSHLERLLPIQNQAATDIVTFGLYDATP